MNEIKKSNRGNLPYTSEELRAVQAIAAEYRRNHPDVKDRSVVMEYAWEKSGLKRRKGVEKQRPIRPETTVKPDFTKLTRKQLVDLLSKNVKPRDMEAQTFSVPMKKGRGRPRKDRNKPREIENNEDDSDFNYDDFLSPIVGVDKEKMVSKRVRYSPSTPTIIGKERGRGRGRGKSGVATSSANTTKERKGRGRGRGRI